ncbi:MAG: hypothetical protein HYY22_00290 [Thaumarchaeota archaeon]|nr:hypothetical protein [Nitrososphaerota archaeon]
MGSKEEITERQICGLNLIGSDTKAINMMCQVDGCNNKGFMVRSIELDDPVNGTLTLTIFLCEEHNEDSRLIATQWIPVTQSSFSISP